MATDSGEGNMMHVPRLGERPSDLVVTLIVEEKEVPVQNLNEDNH